MTCSVEWRVPGDISATSQQAMAGLLDKWLPYAFALIPASRPVLAATPPPSNVAEFDRPCAEKWCPATASYLLSDGRFSISTVLNITDVGGTQP